MYKQVLLLNFFAENIPKKNLILNKNKQKKKIFKLI